jgi:hypothetical protein
VIVRAAIWQCYLEVIVQIVVSHLRINICVVSQSRVDERGHNACTMLCRKGVAIHQRAWLRGLTLGNTHRPATGWMDREEELFDLPVGCSSSTWCSRSIQWRPPAREMQHDALRCTTSCLRTPSACTRDKCVPRQQKR